MLPPSPYPPITAQSAVFGITPALKRKNRQYWGRELGMCWQKLIVELCRQTCDNFAPALRFNGDEPCDLMVGQRAMDTKYRIGSGDSGTLKKFKIYGRLLKEPNYEPILLIVREDNLPAAISACQSGGWTIFTGESTFEYLNQLTGFDLKTYLMAKASAYKIDRV
ncbi:hypothetical protein [Roseofilum sp. SBFL]|uniref:hypothetical protein n=2 Tax=unclassified Roseofilum TaxID=2620099 RepID=UPI00298DB956|nr:hypothetical protein [Roseofilum sp. SBFL]